jgi:hypothetical protein
LTQTRNRYNGKQSALRGTNADYQPSRESEHKLRLKPSRKKKARKIPPQNKKFCGGNTILVYETDIGTEREKSASRERVKSARRHGGAGDVFLMVSLAAPFSISFLPCLVHSRGLDGSTNIWLPILRLLGHAFLKSFPSLSGSFRIG